MKDMNWDNLYSSLQCTGTIYESKHDFSMQTQDLQYSKLDEKYCILVHLNSPFTFVHSLFF